VGIAPTPRRCLEDLAEMHVPSRIRRRAAEAPWVAVSAVEYLRRPMLRYGIENHRID